MTYTIQLRRDLAANWTAINPILNNGELGIETDTKKGKLGDGATAWNSLPYWNPGGVSGGVTSAFGRTGAVVATTGDYTAAQVGAVATSAVGAASGVASLDSGAHVPAAQLPLPLTIAQGGTGQTAQQAAINALTGTQSAGKVLRSDGTNATLAAIQAADVPQLTQYSPIGLTGATTPTSYAGGTVSGHPLSGTWSQGQWVLDESGRIYVCVTGGTPGTWRRVGAMPYQFFLDDYCKGDGKQALVTTVAGSAVINTTPLAAPSAPAPTNAATGGTILAGVYGVIVTYVNRWGETVGSSAGTTTTSGSTSTITVPPPALSGNATGWYAYVTQPGGSTYYRQQAAGSPSTMSVSLILTAPPTTSGANPPGSDTSAAQVFTSTAVDGGKNIMICGGLGTPGGPWIDTIASVQSPTQATLSSNGSGQGGNVNQGGCAMVFSSDDRLAIDQCISDATAYARANNNICQVIGGDKNYGLGTGLFQSTVNTAGSNPAGLAYNTQVRVPVGNPSGEAEKLEFQLLGPGDNAHAEFWVSQLVALNGCTFISYSMGPNSADPTYGQQSVIGGPLGALNFSLSSGFANAKAVIKGVQVVQPGWHNSIGIDLQWMGGILLRGSSVAFAPSTTTGGGVNPSSGWINNSFWQNKIGIALQTPNGGNNDDCVIESFTAEGITTSLRNASDHLVVNRLVTLNTYWGIRLNAGISHALTIAQWSFENVGGAALQVLSGTVCNVNIVMDGENGDGAIVWDIQDTSNVLHGVIRWNDNFRTTANAPSVSGGANVEIINGTMSRAVQAAPSYTLGTAFQNPWWKHMTLTLAGGTVTGISIGPASGSMTSLGITAGTFRLPSGWWLNIAGSVKPTTFIAVPD